MHWIWLDDQQKLHVNTFWLSAKVLDHKIYLFECVWVSEPEGLESTLCTSYFHGFYPFLFATRGSNSLRILIQCTGTHMDAATEWLVGVLQHKRQKYPCKTVAHNYLQAFYETQTTKQKLFWFRIKTIVYWLLHYSSASFTFDEIWTLSAPHVLFKKRKTFRDSAPNGLAIINNAKSQSCFSSHPQ